MWVAVTHGDIVKSILADALGMHLDLFQRIQVDPASISIVSYTSSRPYVLATNTHEGDLSWMAAKPSTRRAQARGRRGGRWRRARPPFRARPRVITWHQSSTASTRPSASSPGRSACPASAPSSSRPAAASRLVSVALEKQQVAALAERIDELLDEVMTSQQNEAVIPAVAPLGLDDDEPLEQPIEEEFRAGTMTLSWDPDDARVVIEVFPFTEAAVVSPDQVDEDFEEPEPDELLLVRITPGAARAFVKRTSQVLDAGRPSCPFCGNPIDPEGHLCVRANGFRRRDP